MEEITVAKVLSFSRPKKLFIINFFGKVTVNITAPDEERTTEKKETDCPLCHAYPCQCEGEGDGRLIM